MVRRRPPRPRPHTAGAAPQLGPTEARRRAVAEWNTPTSAKPRSPAERQAELEQRALMWHRCTMELERVRQQLRGAGSDAGAIATRPAKAPASSPPGRSRLKARTQARSLAPPARCALSRAARLHPGAGKDAVARVRTRAVHARRRQARQRCRVDDRLARSRCSPPSLAVCTAHAGSSTAPNRSRPSSGPSSCRSKRRLTASGRARARTSTPRRRLPGAPASHCRPGPGCRTPGRRGDRRCEATDQPAARAAKKGAVGRGTRTWATEQRRPCSWRFAGKRGACGRRPAVRSAG